MLFAKNFRQAWALVRALSSTDQYAACLQRTACYEVHKFIGEIVRTCLLVHHRHGMLGQRSQAAALPHTPWATPPGPYTTQQSRGFKARPEWAQDLVDFAKRGRSSLSQGDRDHITSILNNQVMQQDMLPCSRVADVLWSTCRLQNDVITQQCRAAQVRVGYCNTCGHPSMDAPVNHPSSGTRVCPVDEANKAKQL